MSQPFTIRGQMADGAIVEEVVTDFARFLAVVVPLRRDPACSAVRWYAEPDGCQAVREAEARYLAALAGRQRAERLSVA